MSKITFFYYKSLYPRLIKQVNDYRNSQLVDVIIDTEVLIGDVGNSLAAFYIGAHKILITQLQNILKVEPDEVLKNGVVGDTLAKAAGITTKQTSSYLKKNP